MLAWHATACLDTSKHIHTEDTDCSRHTYMLLRCCNGCAVSVRLIFQQARSENNL